MPSRRTGSRYIVPQRIPPCQLGTRQTSETSRKSPTQGALRVAPKQQWITTTSGRISNGHSWLAAFHWAADPKAKRYTPSSSHGPKAMNTTTLAIAQELANLAECRPGIAYLMRKLNASERTIEYHLGMLREAGLLVYRTKGTRISGGIRHASVYERVIPAEFDAAFGIRTIQRDETAPAYTRVPVGAAAEHRKELGKLAKKAARKPRRTSRKKIVAGGSRCTPMQGGTSTVSADAGTWVSPRGKLASGATTSPIPQQPKPKTARGKKTLNRVGRRYQLARECQTLMPWLGRGSLPRLSWILRDVADAGWTALEVQAVAEDAGPIVDRDVARPSGLLAHRLKGAHLLYDTPSKRRTAVEAWRDSRVQQRVRHDGYDHGLTGTPDSGFVQRLMREAMARVRGQAPTCPDGPGDADSGLLIDAGTVTALEDLSRAEVLEMRAAAERDHDLVLMAVETAGEDYARRLYTHQLVDRALHARSTSTMTLNPWQEATYA